MSEFAATILGDGFSLDNYFHDLTRHGKDVLVIKTEVGNCHPLLSDGDVLVVEKCGDCKECVADTWMVLTVNGHYILRQKKDFGPELRRSRMRVSGKRKGNSVVAVGRVLAWLHAKPL